MSPVCIAIAGCAGDMRIHVREEALQEGVHARDASLWHAGPHSVSLIELRPW